MINQCVFDGRLVGDPTSKEIPTSKGPAEVVSFSIAVRQNVKDQDTFFMNCTAFGKSGEFVKKYLKKGAYLVVTGSYSERMSEKDGQKRYFKELKVTDVSAPNTTGSSFSANPATDTAGNPVSNVVADNDIPF